MPASKEVSQRVESDAFGGDRFVTTALLILASGFVWLLIWPPFNLWPLSFIWAGLLLRAAIGSRGWFGLGLCCLVVYGVCWAWMLRWTWAVTGAGYPMVSLYSTAWMVAFALLLRRLDRRLPSVPLAVLAPIVWVGLEYLRAEVVLESWPWYLAGLPLIEFPVLCQIADLGGVFLVSMLVLSFGGGLADQFRLHPQPNRTLVSWVVALVAMGGALTYGLIRMSPEPGAVMGRFLLVQTNVPQDNKIGWTIEHQLQDIPTAMRQTQVGLQACDGADLVIWPEVSIAGAGFEPDMADWNIRFEDAPGSPVYWPNRIREMVAQLDVPLLLGTMSWAGDWTEWIQDDQNWQGPEFTYNSAVLLRPDGTASSYHKIFPTPFGERMPWIDSWPWLREQLLALGARGLSLDLDAGPEANQFLLRSDGPTMATPICFEATVPSVTRRLATGAGQGDRADLLINITNDGWFGDVDGGRLAHAQAARFRCIELRRPMLRIANTGQTAWYDGDGRQVDSLALRTPGVLLAEPRADSRRTLYAVLGNVLPIACLIVTLAALLLTIRRTGSAP